MKLGCFGCLFLVMAALVVVVLAIGVFVISGNVLGSPEFPSVAFSKADGYAAQRKLYEVVLRQAGRSSRKDPIILTEREASAFLSHHLEEAGRRPLSLSDLIVKFGPGEFVARGHMPLRSLIQDRPFAYLVPYISAKWLDQSVWVSIRGRINIEASASGGKRYGKVIVSQFELGRQPVGTFLLYAMLGPSGGGLLEWPVPPVVESVQIENGQAIIGTR
jgi:hypothetical protein